MRVLHDVQLLTDNEQVRQGLTQSTQILPESIWDDEHAVRHVFKAG